MPYQCILFDLDGTLVDSVPDIHQALNVALDAIERAPVSMEQTRHWVGNGVHTLIKRALCNQLTPDPQSFTEDEFNQALHAFNQHYKIHNADLCQPYPSVLDTLTRLKQQGLKLAIVTNKPYAFTIPLLQQLQLLDLFTVVVGGDTLAQSKPAPEPLWYAQQQCGAALAETLMVGDSIHDVKAAQQAGIPIVAMRYGYNHGQDIALANPDWICDQLSALFPILAQRH